MFCYNIIIIHTTIKWYALEYKLGVEAMLVDIKARIEDTSITELMALTVFPDPELLEKTLNEYKSNDDLELLAFEEDGKIIGIIGIENIGKTIAVNHLAVHPMYRGMGFGRGLILELIILKKPNEIIAETDEEDTQFFRSIGFSVHSLGEDFPGNERFKCVYTV